MAATSASLLKGRFHDISPLAKQMCVRQEPASLADVEGLGTLRPPQADSAACELVRLQGLEVKRSKKHQVSYFNHFVKLVKIFRTTFRSHSVIGARGSPTLKAKFFSLLIRFKRFLTFIMKGPETRPEISNTETRKHFSHLSKATRPPIH